MLNEVVIAIDSHLKDEYELIRIGGDFDKVFENVSVFWELRNSPKYKSKKIRVSISGIKLLDTQNQFEFKKFWENYSDDAYLNYPEERWNTYANQKHPELRKSCLYPWERMYIWHDGTVNPCDVDYKSFLSPGNLKDIGSIETCWRQLNSLRASHLSQNRSMINPCDRCGVYHECER